MLAFNINWITHHVFFCIRLLSLSIIAMMVSTLFHVSVHITLYEYTSWAVLLLMDIWTGSSCWSFWFFSPSSRISLLYLAKHYTLSRSFFSSHSSFPDFKWGISPSEEDRGSKEWEAWWREGSSLLCMASQWYPTVKLKVKSST